jgi:carbamoyl-phosphate synthase small subunit
MSKKAYLVLESGEVFEGLSFGAEADVVGEIVFTTAMTGYLETLTDPSYYGQIVVQTFPLIGNYGVIPADFESSRPWVSAYIVREWCQAPSNFRCEGTLDTFLKKSGIPGLYGIDTRRLTKLIRERGVMNAFLTTDESRVPSGAELCRPYVIRDAVKSVSSFEPYENIAENQKRTVVLWDFGAKENISRELIKRGCKVVRVPCDTTAEDVLSYNPAGIMLSNGPGDPAENVGIIDEIKKVADSGVPVFGICLGHQLMALSQGARTAKLKYGHRGTNQPVKEMDTGRVYITTQNHGYAVVSDSLPSNAVESYVNANDGTCEGVVYTDKPVFTVQFHPEACGGPLDTRFLFDRFISMMDGKREK